MQPAIIAQRFCYTFFFTFAEKSVKSAITHAMRACYPALRPEGDSDHTRYIYSNCLCDL